MKKILTLAMFLLFICSTAFAVSEGQDAQRQARREEVKKIKQAQKAAKQTSAAQATNPQGGFWHREAERSGFSKFQMSNIQKSVGNINIPGYFKSQSDKYNARKACSK